MASVTMRSLSGGDAGAVELDGATFGIEPNIAVMHQVVTAQLAARRSGTQSTKTRAEVRVLAGWGEIVGMTMAAEATLARELDPDFGYEVAINLYTVILTDTGSFRYSNATPAAFHDAADRIARSLGQDVMVSDFVEAAKVRGEGLWWIITREILPNIAMPLATDFGLRFVYIILFISSLSFLGLGVQPPMSDWGSMVKENLAGLLYGSIAPLVPSLAIATLTIAINMIVDDISAHSGGKLAKRMI
jgi:hypothetical protein